MRAGTLRARHLHSGALKNKLSPQRDPRQTYRPLSDRLLGHGRRVRMSGSLPDGSEVFVLRTPKLNVAGKNDIVSKPEGLVR